MIREHGRHLGLVKEIGSMSDGAIKKTLSQMVDELRGKSGVEAAVSTSAASSPELEARIGEVSAVLALVAAKVDQIARTQTLILERLDTLAGHQDGGPQAVARIV